MKFTRFAAVPIAAISLAFSGVGCSDSSDADVTRGPHDPLIQSDVREDSGFTNKTTNGTIQNTGTGNMQDLSGNTK